MCVRLGVAAIGCVFFPPSPRHVELSTARAICRAVARKAATVGVFVNATYADIMGPVEHCGLTAVQLHGRESPRLVARLRRQGLTVVKALFVNGTPALAAAANYEASAFLVECSGGPLPGGNAISWDWTAARDLCRSYPCVVAGGLTPGNVGRAISACHPTAVDVSSGVELSPGRKDSKKIASFVSAVVAASSPENTIHKTPVKIF